MLKIEDLQVSIGDREVLQHIDLEIKPGETHILFGPNGSGKTTLLMTILGYPQYRVTAGKIEFKGVDITHMPVHERTRLGIGMSFQRPPTIHGLKTRQMVQICGRGAVDVEALAAKVNFTDFLERDINAGFSGGEIKRSELLQLMAQDADLLLFDEPESGVDLENIALIGNTISSLLQRDFRIDADLTQKDRRQQRTKMGLIITHTGFILDHVTADKGQVLYDGRDELQEQPPGDLPLHQAGGIRGVCAMYDMMNEKAAQAKDKKAALGPDIDLSSFTAEPTDHGYMEDLTKLPMIDRQRILESGVDATEEGRSGTYVQEDTSVLHAHSLQDGLEVLPIKRALKEKDWIREYYWKLVAVDADKYTAAAQLNLHEGYVIRALPGAKVTLPVQACLYIHKEGLSQYVHNLNIAEEGSELHVHHRCATAPTLKRGLHVGISEFFVKKNAMLSFTMIHNWAEEMSVRPRSVGVVEEGGLFLNNYICMKPVRSLQNVPHNPPGGKGCGFPLLQPPGRSPGSELDVGGKDSPEVPGNAGRDHRPCHLQRRADHQPGRPDWRGPRREGPPGCRGLMLRGGLIHAIPNSRRRSTASRCPPRPPSGRSPRRRSST